MDSIWHEPTLKWWKSRSSVGTELLLSHQYHHLNSNIHLEIKRIVVRLKKASELWTFAWDFRTMRLTKPISLICRPSCIQNLSEHTLEIPPRYLQCSGEWRVSRLFVLQISRRTFLVTDKLITANHFFQCIQGSSYELQAGIYEELTHLRGAVANRNPLKKILEEHRKLQVILDNEAVNHVTEIYVYFSLSCNCNFWKQGRTLAVSLVRVFQLNDLNFTVNTYVDLKTVTKWQGHQLSEVIEMWRIATVVRRVWWSPFRWRRKPGFNLRMRKIPPTLVGFKMLLQNDRFLEHQNCRFMYS